MALEPYLVAVDGSEASQRAVLCAISLARQDRRTLVFVHAVETEDHRHDASAKTPSIDDALRAAESAGIPADFRILHGRAREEIIAAAIDVDPRFIFVGTSGLTSLEGWFLGSVAADVVRYSHKPVVVVPPTAQPPKDGEPLLSRILVPIDPGAEETSAATIAIALAKEAQGHILFCAVVDENRLLSAEGQAGYMLPDLITEVRSGAQEVIDAASAQARASGVAAEGCVESGEPVAAICKLAGEKNATVIVMGTHGRQRLSRMFLGSTTQGVLRVSPIPVVTLLLGHKEHNIEPEVDATTGTFGRKLPST